MLAQGANGSKHPAPDAASTVAFTHDTVRALLVMVGEHAKLAELKYYLGMAAMVAAQMSMSGNHTTVDSDSPAAPDA